MIVKPREPQKLALALKEKPLVLYGFGGAGVSIARWCDENQIEYIFADQNAVQKQGATQKKIVLPEMLPEKWSDANIVISSILYYDEIVEKLLRLGIDRKRILSYQMFFQERITWKDLEDAVVWGTHTGRVKDIAEWIPAGVRSVADYGEGKLNLKKYLAPATAYYPIDYIKRSQETIICDFDQDRLPDIKADVSVCTATLIFITHAPELLEHLCTHTLQTIILSYVTLDTFPNVTGRRASGYMNDFTQQELQAMLSKYGFKLEAIRPDSANKIDTQYLFCKKQ